MPLEDLFCESDVITIHTALTDTSHGLVNAENLGLMKRSAIVVNTSRGTVIDEPALIDALKTGKMPARGWTCS